MVISCTVIARLIIASVIFLNETKKVSKCLVIFTHICQFKKQFEIFIILKFRDRLFIPA